MRRGGDLEGEAAVKLVDLCNVLQGEMHDWRLRNFPEADPEQQLLGVVEEVGELAHAHLKDIQGIRGDAYKHEAESRDAIGDMLIYLMGYCSYREWSLAKILLDTWQDVKQRNWIANPEDGLTK
jgi:NTP pyrophosphatase (non-canonical NTP hydrolase)